MPWDSALATKIREDAEEQEDEPQQTPQRSVRQDRSDETTHHRTVQPSSWGDLASLLNNPEWTKGGNA